MSIEQNIERIATALEKLVEIAANPKVAATETASLPPPPTTRTRKKAEPPLPETKQEEVKQPETKQENKAADDDDWGFEEKVDPPLSQIRYTNPEAKEKAEELSTKSFSDNKENFYELLNGIRASYGEKNADAGKEKAREIGYAILDEQLGTRKLDEATLPKDKFFDFTYAVEVARADFFKSK